MGISPVGGATDEGDGTRRIGGGYTEEGKIEARGGEERKEFKIKVRKSSKTVNRALTRARAAAVSVA